MNVTEVPENSFTCRAITNIKSGKDEQGNMLHGTFSFTRTQKRARRGEDGAGEKRGRCVGALLYDVIHLK